MSTGYPSPPGPPAVGAPPMPGGPAPAPPAPGSYGAPPAPGGYAPPAPGGYTQPPAPAGYPAAPAPAPAPAATYAPPAPAPAPAPSAPPMGAPAAPGYPAAGAPPAPAPHGYPQQAPAPAPAPAPAGQYPQQPAPAAAPAGGYHTGTVAAPAGGVPQFYGTSAEFYAEEANNLKSGAAGDDFHDSWKNGQRWIIRIAPPLTQDGKIARPVTKIFVPKSLHDPASEKDCFVWNADAERLYGRRNPIIDALARLKQMGVPETLLDPLEPTEVFYVQGWFRDDVSYMNLTRNKAKFIALKPSMYSAVASAIGTQSQLYGDLFNPHRGWDWCVQKTGSGMQTRYTMTVVPCGWTGGAGPIHPDANVVNEALASLVPLPEKFPVPDQNRVAEMEAAAQRILDHFSRMGASYGAMIPGYGGGQPTSPQMPQHVAHAGAPPMGPVGAPVAPHGHAAPAAPAPGFPPGAGPAAPAAAPPPYAGAPAPHAVAPVAAPTPGFPQAAPGYGGGAPAGFNPYPQSPESSSFSEGSTAPAQAVEPQITEGGASVAANGVVRAYTLDEARQIVSVWGIDPACAVELGEGGYSVTVDLPQGSEHGTGRFYFSLVEEGTYVKGPWKGHRKFWKTESASGLKRHVNGILKAAGIDAIAGSSSGGKKGQPEVPAVPVPEPSLPGGPAATSPAPAPEPEPVAAPAPVAERRFWLHNNGETREVSEQDVQDFVDAGGVNVDVMLTTESEWRKPADYGLTPRAEEAPFDTPASPSAPAPAPAPQSQWTSPQPAPGTAMELNRGQHPQCFYDAANPGGSGFYVVSVANPVTCAACPSEEPCRMAADTHAGSSQA